MLAPIRPRDGSKSFQDGSIRPREVKWRTGKFSLKRTIFEANGDFFRASWEIFSGANGDFLLRTGRFFRGERGIFLGPNREFFPGGWANGEICWGERDNFPGRTRKFFGALGKSLVVLCWVVAALLLVLVTVVVVVMVSVTRVPSAPEDGAALRSGLRLAARAT